MNGWFRIGTAWGAPIEAHFSLPLVLAALSGFRLAPVFWALATLLILVHELGHAVVARSMGLHVQRIALHGLGGHIETEYPGSPAATARLASGGVLAQLAVLAVFLPFAVLDDRKDAAWLQARDTLVNWNLAMIFLNLLPVPPLDGHRIWPWVRMRLAAWWATGSPDAKGRRRGGRPLLRARFGHLFRRRRRRDDSLECRGRQRPADRAPRPEGRLTTPRCAHASSPESPPACSACFPLMRR